METLRKQASKLREHVAKQQQWLRLPTMPPPPPISAWPDARLKTGIRECGELRGRAVRKQFSARHNQDPSLVDEVELECHQNLQRLYNSTRAAKVFEPLREMIMSAPLEDARLLTYRYQRIRQDMESQVDAERAYHQNAADILNKLHDEVIHPFDAQADGELSISVGDYVVVRQVAPNGWSEGECKGKAGWFPSAYVEQRDKAPATKQRTHCSIRYV
uniref:SH3 domain-containing protein n=1 Tax=Oryza meridionalis TaxID=40149 RepID=A0A0E0CYH9_9ORYZ